MACIHVMHRFAFIEYLTKNIRNRINVKNTSKTRGAKRNSKYTCNTKETCYILTIAFKFVFKKKIKEICIYQYTSIQSCDDDDCL